MQFASNTPPLILPPLLKLPSRCTCSIIISKLFFTAVAIPLSKAWVCACVCVCMSVVSVIVKRPVLPPCAADGCSRNPLLLLWCYTEVHMSYTHISPSTKLCHMQWCHTAVICPWHTSTSSTNSYMIFYRATHIRNHPHSHQNYHLKWCYTEVHMSTSCPTHLSMKLSNEAVLHTGSLCVCPLDLVRSFQCS